MENGLKANIPCEHCGVEHKKTGKYLIVTRYYSRYNQVLCDRCVDNKDGITIWDDELSIRLGFPPFIKRRIT